jgi:hypothetical protein
VWGLGSSSFHPRRKARTSTDARTIEGVTREVSDVSLTGDDEVHVALDESPVVLAGWGRVTLHLEDDKR